jgi:hypothetical protein
LFWTFVAWTRRNFSASPARIGISSNGPLRSHPRCSRCSADNRSPAPAPRAGSRLEERTRSAATAGRSGLQAFKRRPRVGLAVGISRFFSLPGPRLADPALPPSARIRHSNGYNYRTVQELAGPKDVQTTMVCTQVVNGGVEEVRSPSTVCGKPSQATAGSGRPAGRPKIGGRFWDRLEAAVNKMVAGPHGGGDVVSGRPGPVLSRSA